MDVFHLRYSTQKGVGELVLERQFILELAKQGSADPGFSPTPLLLLSATRATLPAVRTESDSVFRNRSAVTTRADIERGIEPPLGCFRQTDTRLPDTVASSSRSDFHALLATWLMQTHHQITAALIAPGSLLVQSI